MNWQKIAELGDKSITDNCRAHRAAIDNTGVGLYYGDHSPFHQDILRGDRAALQTQIDAMSAGDWRMASVDPGFVTMENSLGPGCQASGEFVYRLGDAECEECL